MLIKLLLIVLMFGLGFMAGAVAVIDRKKPRSAEDMTFKEFVAWCNERACDGCWGFNTVIACINAMNEVKLSPPWAREAAWQRVNREHRIVRDYVIPTNKKIEEYLKEVNSEH